MVKEMTDREKAIAEYEKAKKAEEISFNRYAEVTEARIADLDENMKSNYVEGDLKGMMENGMMLAAMRKHYRNVCEDPSGNAYFRLSDVKFEESVEPEMYACVPLDDLEQMLSNDDIDRIYS